MDEKAAPSDAYYYNAAKKAIYRNETGFDTMVLDLKDISKKK